MSQFVEVQLDRPRQFRFTIFDARDACRYLSNIPGNGPVDTLGLLLRMARKDYDTWSAVLSEGLKHEEPGIRPDRALRYLQMMLDGCQDDAERARKMGDLSTAIRRAGEISGVWEALDEGQDTDRGNVSRPSSVGSRPST